MKKSCLWSTVVTGVAFFLLGGVPGETRAQSPSTVKGYTREQSQALMDHVLLENGQETQKGIDECAADCPTGLTRVQAECMVTAKSLEEAMTCENK